MTMWITAPVLRAKMAPSASMTAYPATPVDVKKASLALTVKTSTLVSSQPVSMVPPVRIPLPLPMNAYVSLVTMVSYASTTTVVTPTPVPMASVRCCTMEGTGVSVRRATLAPGAASLTRVPVTHVGTEENV